MPYQHLNDWNLVVPLEHLNLRMNSNHEHLEKRLPAKAFCHLEEDSDTSDTKMFFEVSGLWLPNHASGEVISRGSIDSHRNGKYEM